MSPQMNRNLCGKVCCLFVRSFIPYLEFPWSFLWCLLALPLWETVSEFFFWPPFHSLLLVVLLYFTSVPSLQTPVGWVTFTSLFATFVNSFCLPCMYSCILYFWEMYKMRVMHVAPHILFHFMFFPNTSSCEKYEPAAQQTGPVAVSTF